MLRPHWGRGGALDFPLSVARQQHQPAELQTLRSELQYITPSTAISSIKKYNRGPHGANAVIGLRATRL